VRTEASRWRPSPLTAGFAAVILVGAAAIGLARLPGELSDQSRTAAAGRSVQRVGSVPVLSPGPRRTAFLAYVRRAVPAGESVRIVQQVTALSPLEGRRAGQPGVCGYSASRTTYYWLVYALESRPSTCDPNARWTMYYGVRPGALPAGASAHRFADGYVLVRR
jgi:hypothetical protein